MLLQFGGDGYRLAGENGGKPFRGPGAFAWIVDARQRLQADGLGRVCGERAAQIMPIAIHGECGRADRPPEIEREDLGAGVAAKLQRHQGQQHALAGAGRSDDQGVSDIADMQREAKRSRALGAREEERRRCRDVRPGSARPKRQRTASCAQGSMSRLAVGAHWRRHDRADFRARLPQR